MTNVEEGIYLQRKTGKKHITRANNGLIRCDKLTSLQLRIYCVLDTYSNCDSIFLTQTDIATKSGNITREWVNKSITELFKIGLLEMDNRFDTKGGQVSSLYFLVDFEEWAEKQGVKCQSYWSALANDLTFTDKLSANQWRLYNVLKTYGGYKHITPSFNELINYSALSRPTIASITKQLEEMELVKIIKRDDVFEGRQPNEYILTDEYVWLQQFTSKQ